MGNDLATFVPMLPTLLAFIVILLGSEELNRTWFLEPVLKSLSVMIGKSSCPSCHDKLVSPYAEMSIRRFALMITLISISLSLLSTAFSLFVATPLQATVAVSFLIYFVATFSLAFYYVLAKKDVFFWWRSPWTRAILTLAVGVGTYTALNNPPAVDIIKFVTHFDYTAIVLAYAIPGYMIFTVAIAVVIAFLVGRRWANREHPSLRRRILLELDEHPEGYTLKKWVEKLSPKKDAHPSRWKKLASLLKKLAKRIIGARPLSEEILVQLEKQVYQCSVIVTFSSREPNAELTFSKS